MIKPSSGALRATWAAVADGSQLARADLAEKRVSQRPLVGKENNASARAMTAMLVVGDFNSSVMRHFVHSVS